MTEAIEFGELDDDERAALARPKTHRPSREELTAVTMAAARALPADPADGRAAAQEEITMTDPFDAPGTGRSAESTLDYPTLLGSLLLVTPYSVETISTTFGDKPAVRADVVALESKAVYTDVLIFPMVLVAQLTEAAQAGGTRMVLGRLERGTAAAGKNAPWRLADPTEADKTAARAYLAASAAAPY